MAVVQEFEIITKDCKRSLLAEKVKFGDYGVFFMQEEELQGGGGLIKVKYFVPYSNIDVITTKVKRIK